MNLDRLKQQLDFIVEIDTLKTVVRQTLLSDGSRQENSAEHSWHLAVMAIVLLEYAEGEVLDLLRVLKMVLIHDLVEIDAGDTFCYDAKANGDKAEREEKAASRLFGLLPAGQAEELRTLWEEFEAGSTAEARFAAALDRLQPLLNNVKTEGRMWRNHGIKQEQVLTRNRPIEGGAPALWVYGESLIRDAVRKGYLSKRARGRRHC